MDAKVALPVAEVVDKFAESWIIAQPNCNSTRTMLSKWKCGSDFSKQVYVHKT